MERNGTRPHLEVVVIALLATLALVVLTACGGGSQAPQKDTPPAAPAGEAQETPDQSGVEDPWAGMEEPADDGYYDTTYMQKVYPNPATSEPSSHMFTDMEGILSKAMDGMGQEFIPESAHTTGILEPNGSLAIRSGESPFGGFEFSYEVSRRKITEVPDDAGFVELFDDALQFGADHSGISKDEFAAMVVEARRAAYDSGEDSYRVDGYENEQLENVSFSGGHSDILIKAEDFEVSVLVEGSSSDSYESMAALVDHGVSQYGASLDEYPFVTSEIYGTYIPRPAPDAPPGPGTDPTVTATVRSPGVSERPEG